MKKANAVRVYETDTNNLKAIEFFDENSEFILQAVWDERDDQTPQKQTDFQEWAYELMNTKGYEIQTLESI